MVFKMEWCFFAISIYDCFTILLLGSCISEAIYGFEVGKCTHSLIFIVGEGRAHIFGKARETAFDFVPFLYPFCRAFDNKKRLGR
jgi:hypothetical protein